MRIFIKRVLLCVVAIMILPSIAFAGVPKDVRGMFEQVFVPAIPHQGLVNAQYPLEMDKIKTFIVVEKGGLIPANRATFLFTPQDYDYRGARIEVDGKVKTRAGWVYTYLYKGLIMAVAGVVYSGDHIYIKLISLKDVVLEKYPEKKATKVTVMLGFKFTKKSSQKYKSRGNVPRSRKMDQTFSYTYRSRKVCQRS